MAEYKRIYFETVKRKWKELTGLTITGTISVFLLFWYLSSSELITVNSYSYSQYCEGTKEDICWAIINFTAKKDIYIYPLEYDPYGRNTPLEFNPGVKEWHLYRSWGKGWREINLSKTWSKKVNYAVKFAKGKTYLIKITALKNNPYWDNIKWSFTDALDPWWNSSWSYRQAVNISNIAGDLTNYQVKIDLNSSNVGSNFDWSNNGSDIRFTNSTDDELNFWIESWDSTGQEATIWVNVTSLPNNTNTTIYMYYGNSDANSVSNGTATFEFFDDFTKKLNYDTAKWDKVGSGTVRKVCESQFTASHGGQGLANDGTYFYWGHNNGAGVSGTIYKIKISDGSEVDSFSGPPHAAGGDWREDHDTLLFSSGGSETPEVWEINPSTGAKIREWDFSGEGYNRGALVAYKSEERIYLFTSDSSSNFKIKEYQINDDGTWSAIGIEYSHSSLGVPQGLDYINEYLYYLYDNGISKLQLNDDGSITVLETLPNLPSREKEGLTYFNGHFYYGDGYLVIRKVLHQIACDFSSNHVSIYSKNANYGTGTALRCRWRASSVTLDYPGFGYGNKGTADIVDDSYGGHGISIGKLHTANDYLQGRQTNDGTNRAETGNICSTQNQFHVFEIRRKSSSAEYVVDDGSPVTLSSYYPTEDLYVGVGGHHGESGESIADWILVRKYTSPEPSVSNFGSEEVAGVSFSITLNSPPNQTTTDDSTPDFNFTVSGTESSYSCELFINDTGYGTATANNNTATIITANQSLSGGTYNWYINCSVRGVTNQSEIREITITVGAWWNTSWSYRQAIYILNTAGDLTNYQVKIELNSSNVGSNFDWSNNGSDIRFVNSTNDLLNYWIESWNSSSQKATIWVNVTSLPNNTNTTIYMYYGNSEASSASDGEATFLFFDDFEGTSLNTSKWDTKGSGNVDVSNSIVDIYETTHMSIYSKTGSYGVDTAIEIKWMGTSFVNAHSYPGFGYGDNQGSNIVDESYANVGITIGKIHANEDFMTGRNRVTNLVETDLSGSTDWDSNYKRYSIKRTSSKIIYVDEGNEYTQTSQVPTSDLYIGIGGHYSFGTGFHSKADWVLVRKYADPEPTVSSFGSEETAEQPDIKIEIWNGTNWIIFNDTNLLEFRCEAGQTECEPTNQDAGNSQSIFKITNNGTGDGAKVEMKLNQTFTDITLKCDDDYTYADAVEITSSYQQIHGALSINSYFYVSCWADYGTNPQPGYFDLSFQIT